MRRSTPALMIEQCVTSNPKEPRGGVSLFLVAINARHRLSEGQSGEVFRFLSIAKMGREISVQG